MTINTKYSIGDQFWLMHNNLPTIFRVANIDIAIVESLPTDKHGFFSGVVDVFTFHPKPVGVPTPHITITYKIVSGDGFLYISDSDKTFPSKEALIKSL